MRVRVLYFSQLRELFGMEEQTIDLERGATVGQVISEILSHEECLRFQNLPLRYAVNENFEDPTKILEDEDTLAILMPMAGG